MKEAFYFTHDSNARHDPKITAMRGVYGSEGYGWYWMFIEMMREAAGYKLDMHSKYAFNAYAMQLHSDSNTIAQFVHDCINEFCLFESDGRYFWSPSLLRRMELREEKAEKARRAAGARWSKNKNNGNKDARDMHEQSECNADASKNDAIKESKVKESKVKEFINSSGSSNSAENPFRLFETEGFGTISSVIADRINVMINDFGERWVCEAMKTAVYYGKRTLSYVDAILKRWKAEGIDNPWEADKEKRGDNGAKYAGSAQGNRHGRDSPTSPEDSITGGRVGWLAKDRVQKRQVQEMQ